MVKRTQGWRKGVVVTVRVVVFLLFAGYALLNVYGYRVDVENQSLQETGVIEIRTLPQQVDIFLDDQRVARQSPYEITGVAIGKHRIRIEREGFVPFTKTVDVDRQFVVRLDQVFLLPINIAQYREEFSFMAEQSWDTSRYIVLFSPSQQRLAAYHRESGTWNYADTPVLMRNVSQVLEGNSSTLWFANSNTLWNWNMTTGTWQHSMLSVAPIQKLVHVDRQGKIIWYTKDTTLGVYDLSTQIIRTVLKDVQTAWNADDNVLVCSGQGQLLGINTTDATLSLRVPAWLHQEDTVCPLQSFLTLGGHNILLSQEGTLWVDGKSVDTKVEHIWSVDSELLVYNKQRALYVLNTNDSTIQLLTRFPTGVQAVTNGPDPEHVFVALQQSLFLCDTVENSCQIVLDNTTTPAVFFFHAPTSTLWFGSAEKLYQIHFPLWQKTGLFPAL